MGSVKILAKGVDRSNDEKQGPLHEFPINGLPHISRGSGFVGLSSNLKFLFGRHLDDFSSPWNPDAFDIELSSDRGIRPYDLIQGHVRCRLLDLGNAWLAGLDPVGQGLLGKGEFFPLLADRHRQLDAQVHQFLFVIAHAHSIARVIVDLVAFCFEYFAFLSVHSISPFGEWRRLDFAVKKHQRLRCGFFFLSAFGQCRSMFGCVSIIYRIRYESQLNDNWVCLRNSTSVWPCKK